MELLIKMEEFKDLENAQSTCVAKRKHVWERTTWVKPSDNL